MKTAAIALSLVASAAAFAPATNQQQRTAGVALQETKADLEALAKDLNPVSSMWFGTVQYDNPIYSTGSSASSISVYVMHVVSLGACCCWSIFSPQEFVSFFFCSVSFSSFHVPSSCLRRRCLRTYHMMIGKIDHRRQVLGFYDPLNLAEAEFWGCK